MLFDDVVEKIIKHDLEKMIKKQKEDNKEPIWVEKIIKIPVIVDSKNEELEIEYFYNEDEGAVIILKPLYVSQLSSVWDPTYKKVIDKIRAEHADRKLSHSDYPGISVSGVLLGKGSSERHYVAFHNDYKERMAIFDSKISNMDRFLNSADSPTFFEKVWGYFVTPIKAIGRALGFIKHIRTSFHNSDVDVYRLGTQAMLDGVSCGYHSAGAVLAIANGLNNPVKDTDSCCSNSTKDIAEFILNHKKNFDKKAEHILTTMNSAKQSSKNTTPAVSPALVAVAQPVVTESVINQPNQSAAEEPVNVTAENVTYREITECSYYCNQSPPC